MTERLSLLVMWLGEKYLLKKYDKIREDNNYMDDIRLSVIKGDKENE